MIENRLLYYFLAVAREQSITRAADVLHIAQPTLSKQMMELEEQIGKKLLIRGKKKITLTEEGHYLRNCAQEIINLVEKTESAFQEDKTLLHGDIYLGCGETPAMEHIVSIFRDINQEYPLIHFHIFSGDADAVMERLDKGLIDIGLLLGPLHQEKYEYQSLGISDTYGLLMPSDSPLAQKAAISFADLKDIPLIFPAQTYAGRQRIEWFHENQDSLNITGTYNLIYNAAFMAEQNIGLVFCLKDLIPMTAERNLCFRPFSPPLTVDLSIVTKKYQTFSPAVKLFLSRLQEKFCSQ